MQWTDFRLIPRTSPVVSAFVNVFPGRSCLKQKTGTKAIKKCAENATN